MVSTSSALEALLRMPVADRAAAARRLLESLDDGPPVPRDEAHALAWRAELERRVAEVDQDGAVMEDGERALAQVRERAAARSARRTP